MIPPPGGIRGWALSLTLSLLAGGIVLALAIGVLAATGMPIGRGFSAIASGALGSPAAIHATLARSGILILTGLAAALAFRIRLYNFGAEGQLQAGALIAAGIATMAGAWPAWAMLPIELAAGAAVGGALMFAATRLKLRRGVEEGIVTLLINFIMVLAADAWLSGRPKPDILALGSSMPAGLAIALAAAVVIAAVIHLTVWGFEFRAIAGNAEAARYAGIPVARVTLRVGLLSGALAGIAGACLVVDTGSTQQPGLGYAGITVAVLAQYSPIGSVAAGLFIAGLIVGTQAARGDGVPAAALPDMLVALALLIGLAALAIRKRSAGTAMAAS
jgi:simple sugar transport system permease protein